MIITIIETIYRFLWGDFLQIPLPGGGSVYYLADTGRNLFYNKDKSVACPVISGDGEGTS